MDIIKQNILLLKCDREIVLSWQTQFFMALAIFVGNTTIVSLDNCIAPKPEKAALEVLTLFHDSVDFF